MQQLLPLLAVFLLLGAPAAADPSPALDGQNGDIAQVWELALDESDALDLPLADVWRGLAEFGSVVEPNGFGSVVEPNSFGSVVEPNGFGSVVEPNGFGSVVEPNG